MIPLAPGTTAVGIGHHRTEYEVQNGRLRRRGEQVNRRQQRGRSQCHAETDPRHSVRKSAPGVNTVQIIS